MSGFAGCADLHVHTTHSDGACSPCQVVVAAARVGLAAVAITDHDTVTAIPIAAAEARRWDVELISGVEISCSFGERGLHLLGYFFRHDDQPLIAALESLRQARVARMNAIVAHLGEQGLVIDLGTIRRLHPRATLGRRQVAEYLVHSGQVASVRDAFVRYLADPAVSMIAKPTLDAYAAMNLLRNAGGVSAWAHPPFDVRFDELKLLRSAGMEALEVDGPGFTKRLSARLRRWAAALDLIPTAGTDFHAPDRPGRWVGAIRCQAEVLAKLRLAADQPTTDLGRAKVATRNETSAQPDDRVQFSSEAPWERAFQRP